jgi:hypothetical protein
MFVFKLPTFGEVEHRKSWFAFNLPIDRRQLQAFLL